MPRHAADFGGTFSVKYPHISDGMLEDKLDNIVRTGARTLVACDMGCLMHIGGGLSRRGIDVQTHTSGSAPVGISAKHPLGASHLPFYQEFTSKVYRRCSWLRLRPGLSKLPLPGPYLIRSFRRPWNGWRRFRRGPSTRHPGDRPRTLGGAQEPGPGDQTPYN